MELPKVYADFHNADKLGRLRLNCNGTKDDLARYGLELRQDMRFIFTDKEEFEVEGVVTYSKDEKIWVAIIDWNNLKRR